MEKIINQKRYNTNTAKKMGEWREGKVWADLYQKKTGEFFVHASGESYNIKEVLIPQTFEQAKEWAAMHLPEDEYDNIFRGSEEGDNVRMDTLLPAKDHWKLKNYAAKTGLTQRDIVLKALRKFLK
jgi:NRPS condensation-like uncharacterized protein